MKTLLPRRLRWLPFLWVLLGSVALWTMADPPAAPTYPSWWIPHVASVQPPADTESPAFADWMADNYRPANLGQLKNFATYARVHLEAALAPIGGAGPAVNALVDGLNEPSSLTNSANLSPANLGQLKAVSNPFYQRLIAVGYTGAVPWTTNVTAANLQPANLGQLKNVFSFDLGSFTLASNLTTDGDSLHDQWEVQNGLDPFSSSAASGNGDDPDGDGLTNAEELAAGTDPLTPDNPGTAGNLSIVLYR